ncbi:MAG: helix-turn-helix transcriptional regulator [Gemmatimonadaceae bacterium]|nr:helix-turn-helix transcriptional regulator [Gemmatimonadaceae bacterium]
MNRQRSIQPDVRLSKREVECLRWAALGKTDQEIAAIISRSAATIRFHIHNAALKLDAVNRSQAVFKASQLGYLGAAN